MTDRPMTAILLALIVESAHWTKYRWEFTEEARDRAWRVTTVLIALAGVLVFLESTPYRALPNLLTWLPPLLLPMQFIQSFGLENSLPVNTFSFLARHRRKWNLRLGLTESLVHVNFGNIYFVTTMVASTLGSRAGSWVFLPGIVILTGWLLLSNSRSRPLPLIVALIVAGGLAIGGQYGIEKLDQLGGSAAGRADFDPDTNSTLIGRPGKVEQSPEIVWRLRPLENSAPPKLLRTASYNDYLEGSWRLRPFNESEFNNLESIEPVIGETYHILAETAKDAAIRAHMPRFDLRGASFNESPLPLPGDAASLSDFELDSVERNSLGTVRVFPKHSVIEGMVLWKGDANPELLPFPKEDLVIPPPERETLRAVVEQLRLAEQPTLQAKLNVIHAWFQRDFSYTRTLTISSWRYGSNSEDSKRTTAITRFLTNVKAGHCEYFAAATTLLLREAGIPARYTIGYAVMERDVKRGEFVIRGTHGHAWCRVWDAGAGRWIDFDTTPGSWLSALPPQATAMQRFNDWLKRSREDFFLWRNRPKNRLAATLVMSAIGLGVIGFVIKKLWRSKRRMESEKRRLSGYEGPISRTALNGLERQAEKFLGPRPPGQPFAEWLSGLRPILADSRALDEALELHQRLRFDPAPPVRAEQERLALLAGELETAIKNG
jgi:hypothetical protein